MQLCGYGDTYRINLSEKLFIISVSWDIQSFRYLVKAGFIYIADSCQGTGFDIPVYFGMQAPQIPGSYDTNSYLIHSKHNIRLRMSLQLISLVTQSKATAEVNRLIKIMKSTDMVGK